LRAYGFDNPHKRNKDKIMKKRYLTAILCISLAQNVLSLEPEKADDRPTKCAYPSLQQPSSITCVKEDYTTKDLERCNFQADSRKEYFHNCDGLRSYKNPTATYTGQFQHNQPNGEGLLKGNEAEYHGFFKDGWKHGLGRAVVYGKRKTEGWWVNGQVNGFAEEQTPNMLYLGNMLNGVKNGHGRALTQNLGKDNFTYVGGWKDGFFDGEGKLEFKEIGFIMSGNFKDGKLNGNGTIISPEYGYTGEFKNNLFDGEGSLVNFDLESETIKSLKAGFFKEGKYLNDVCTKMGFTLDTADFSKCILDLITSD
jgi:hypothetical protein